MKNDVDAERRWQAGKEGKREGAGGRRVAGVGARREGGREPEGDGKEGGIRQESERLDGGVGVSAVEDEDVLGQGSEEGG